MKRIYFLAIICFLLLNHSNLNAQIVWIGDDITFTKEGSTDWTLEENQDRLTENVWLARQNNKAIYNYKWWQDNFSADATSIDIYFNLWNDLSEGNPSQIYTPSGGTQGVRWALLDDTGSTSDWTGYEFGVLGDSTNFHSLNNIIEIIEILEDYSGNFNTIEVIDDFSVLYNGYTYDVPDVGDYIVGKKFGLWLMEDDVYLTLTFNSWGTGAAGAGFSYSRSTDAVINTDELVNSSEITLFPNPTVDFLRIKGFNSVENYVIYNSLGSKVKESKVVEGGQIDVREFENGLYFIKFKNGEIARFIKE